MSSRSLGMMGLAETETVPHLWCRFCFITCSNNPEKSVFLPPIWSPVEGAKREAGVSPAQSRCCKLI